MYDTIGDPTTARSLQDLNQQLIRTGTPGAAMALQQQMAAAQLQGAENILATANAPKPHLPGVNTPMMDAVNRQFAMMNLDRARQMYNQNILAIQQAANSPYALNALGVPGKMPTGGSVGPLISSIQGGSY